MKMNGNEKTKLKSLKDGTLRDTNTLTTPSERSFSSLLVHSSSLLIDSDRIWIDLSRVWKKTFENIQHMKSQKM